MDDSTIILACLFILGFDVGFYYGKEHEKAKKGDALNRLRSSVKSLKSSVKENGRF